MASLNINTILLHKVGLVQAMPSLGDTDACSSDAKTAGSLPMHPALRTLPTGWGTRSWSHFSANRTGSLSGSREGRISVTHLELRARLPPSLVLLPLQAYIFFLQTWVSGPNPFQEGPEEDWEDTRRAGREKIASAHPTRGLLCCRQWSRTLGAERDGRKFLRDPEERSWFWLPSPQLLQQLCFAGCAREHGICENGMFSEWQWQNQWD